MPYKLSTFVHVDEGGGEGRTGWFGPEDELPDWAVAAITNPDVWDGDQPPHIAGAGSAAKSRGTAVKKPAATATKVAPSAAADSASSA